MRYAPYIEADLEFPRFHPVRMAYPSDRVEDIAGALNQALDQVLPNSGIAAGHRVAVGVGSRGIAQLPLMVQVLCARLTSLGARPFIVPAMGSHGGATAAGQERVLQTLGVDADTCGVPVRSSLDVERIGTVFGQVPVYFSRDALQADHTVCLNRVKPHTKFKARVESGLCKMLCVGLGKHQGALSYHEWALKHGFARLLMEMATAARQNSNFRFGVGVVENAYDNLLKIEAVTSQRLIDAEIALLEIAKRHFARLPIKDLDALIVGRIGKEISGSGMDPNVTGRAYDLGESDFSENLRATRVAILNLSPSSRGNAIGLGNADFITEKVFRRMDYETTLMNAMTSMSLRKAFIPIRMPSDAKAIQACFTTLGPVDPQTIRAVIIPNTLEVYRFWVSSALGPVLKKVPQAELSKTISLAFDPQGNLKVPSI